MQTYPLKISGAANVVVMVDATLFVYESGTATPTSGDTRIRVKPESGEEIVLRPGQRFRIPDKHASRWNVSTYDGTTAIDGMIVIGAGEFDDANTLNKVTLDATLANNVTVMNTADSRVPVTLDTTQTITVSGGVVAYTHSYNSNTGSVGGVAIKLLDAALNVNGAMLEKFDFISGADTQIALIAKATAPATPIDGDLLFATKHLASNVVTSMDVSKNGRVKVPAGKGIWYYSWSADSASVRSALMTVL